MPGEPSRLVAEARKRGKPNRQPAAAAAAAAPSNTQAQAAVVAAQAHHEAAAAQHSWESNMARIEAGIRQVAYIFISLPNALN